MMLLVLQQATIWLSLLMVIKGVDSDPQLNLLNSGCSQYKVNNLEDFSTNLNATFLKLRQELTAAADSHDYFATADQAAGSDPAYAMVQCRNYLSPADCLACFDAALTKIENCSATGANGARVIYDGCFLRYESNNFYNQSTQEGRSMICGNQTDSNPEVFDTTVQDILNDLQVATPRINGYFAATATNKAAAAGSNVTAVYAVAQCIETISQSGCRNCLAVVNGDNRQCPPNKEGRAVDVGCFLRYSTTPFFADNQTTDLTAYLLLKDNGNSSKKRALIGGLVGGVGFLLLMMTSLIVFVWFKLCNKKMGISKDDLLDATELQGPMKYNYKELKSATKNFNPENRLGEGGFGEVYKGVLKNGKVVAVKKLTIFQSLLRVKQDFLNEVKIISNVHHRNLTRLLGCCIKGPQLLLVYEFMSNGSLDKSLFGGMKSCLDWKQRLDIILGTAKGLAYLHEEFHLCIIHRDIKPSNILLDHDFQPKIADFGLARLLPQDQSHLSTRFAGTLGYTAPEYAIHGQLSEKVDIYSFGILVLEIISGQKSSSETKSDEFLLKLVWRLYETDTLQELVDDSLDPSQYQVEEVKKIIEIGLMCTQSSPSSRPTMSEVVVLLISKASLDNRPTKPTFIETHIKDSSTFTGSSASQATVSTFQCSGR